MNKDIAVMSVLALMMMNVVRKEVPIPEYSTYMLFRQKKKSILINTTVLA